MTVSDNDLPDILDQASWFNTTKIDSKYQTAMSHDGRAAWREYSSPEQLLPNEWKPGFPPDEDFPTKNTAPASSPPDKLIKEGS